MSSTPYHRSLAWARVALMMFLLATARQCVAAGTTDSALAEIKRKFVTANHILDRHGIVDAFGHASVRASPEDGDGETFLMARGVASALVASDADLALYRISDAEPVVSPPPPSGDERNRGKGRAERFIHSEILKRFPGVGACVHAHTPAVLPYATTAAAVDGVGGGGGTAAAAAAAAVVRFAPTFHMVGFLGSGGVPLWDIVPLYNATDIQDNLVTQPRFGASLAEAFGGGSGGGNSSGNGMTTFPEHVFVLMKQHGFTTCAATIEEAVYQAVYAKEAALTETGQLVLRQARCAGAGAGDGEAIEALSPEQVRGTANFAARFGPTPWELWTRQVEVDPLYRNDI